MASARVGSPPRSTHRRWLADGLGHAMARRWVGCEVAVPEGGRGEAVRPSRQKRASGPVRLTMPCCDDRYFIPLYRVQYIGARKIRVSTLPACSYRGGVRDLRTRGAPVRFRRGSQEDAEPKMDRSTALGPTTPETGPERPATVRDAGVAPLCGEMNACAVRVPTAVDGPSATACPVGDIPYRTVCGHGKYGAGSLRLRHVRRGVPCLG